MFELTKMGSHLHSRLYSLLLVIRMQGGQCRLQQGVNYTLNLPHVSLSGINIRLFKLIFFAGDMEDSSTLKHHDIVPGAQLSMHIWNSWLSLIQACVKGNVQKVPVGSGMFMASLIVLFGN